MKKINIKGVIVPDDIAWIYDLFGIEATNPKRVNAQLDEANGEDIEVSINSPGGDVFSGSEIYTTLKDYSGTITTKIVGIAASAASVVAMASDKTMMSPTAQMMIHNAATIAGGDHRAMAHTSEVLKTVDKSITNAYRIKSGLEEKELLDLMGQETWFTAQHAKEKGLIDAIMFEDDQVKLSASAALSPMLPQQVIDKVRNGLFVKEEPNNQNEEEEAPTQASILLKKLDLIAEEA
jgi:ATP-dependent Clp protease protease subunit